MVAMSTLGCVPHPEELDWLFVDVPRVDRMVYMGPNGEAWCEDCAKVKRYPLNAESEEKRAIYDSITPLPVLQ